LGLTGPFQAVQWAAISVASILVGVGGGWLAEHKFLSLTFLTATVFPVMTMAMAIFMINEPRVQVGERQFSRDLDGDPRCLGLVHSVDRRGIYLLLQFQSFLWAVSELSTHHGRSFHA
jgi:hypothetical protein